MSEWTIWKKIKRRVSVGNGLRFDYEVSPHRAFVAKAQGTNADSAAPSHVRPAKVGASIPVGAIDSADNIGDFLPFKQSRLKGTINPLRPPLHVETVLIGRALGQPTGYLFGIGFRVRDDGYIEAEFADGVRKFDTYEKFEAELKEILLHVEVPKAAPL